MESPQVTARVAAVFYALVFPIGGFAFFASGAFVVAGDAAATAANLLTHESSVRAGFAATLLSTACYVVVTALFYELFKPVNRSLSLTAAFFSLVGCVTGGIAALFQLAPLAVLQGANYLSVFKPEQLNALAYLFLKLDALVNNVGFTFFGFYCCLIGCLILKSAFLPRILGVLMVFAGLGWLTSSFASALSPPLYSHLVPYIMLPGMIGEASLTLWLLVMGVNAQRWKEQAIA